MATTSPAKVRNVTALVCAILVALIVSVGAFLGNHKPVVAKQDNVAKMEIMAQYVIDEMPDSALRSNLLTVFGAEYAGESQMLNKLMLKYAEMKIQQLNNGI